MANALSLYSAFQKPKALSPMASSGAILIPWDVSYDRT
ncbi:hypothetical protein BTN49_1597 [Candidatus Enterovibrio escicola]|uniref:Uncharacterized protein n=1 Tax=Candidatus Enterovibrio escicola TaxID=1927127 RepID=A0A2A5T392_9GAMM|nr:hypothetical protein BTN49_1597 [Candidatus Enterovibrio escacola]